MLGEQFIQFLPEVGILDRLFTSGFPAPFFPAFKPFSNPPLNVLRVGPELYGARLLEGSERMNYCANFHAVIGGEFCATMQVFFMTARAQYRSPAAGARVAFAGPIGINNDVVSVLGIGHSQLVRIYLDFS